MQKKMNIIYFNNPNNLTTIYKIFANTEINTETPSC